MTSEMVQPTGSEQGAVTTVEKMVPESVMIGKVQERYNAGYEKAKREAEEQYRSQQAQAPSQDDMRKMVQQEMHGLVTQAVAEQNANQFLSKIRAASLEYPNLEQQVAKHVNTLSPLLPYLNGVENTTDVVNEIVNHPSKAHLLKLAVMTGDVSVVQDELASLSRSIADNKKALAGKTSSSQPLSQVKPSTTGSGDNGGQPSISELRKNPLYKC